MALQRHYFGTDGVRGEVGKSPLTADFALRLANAAARVLAPNGGTVLIGKDTRLSGYMFESALEAGFIAAGVDVALIGPLPTPGIAYMGRHLKCAFGVVISASHNVYTDNGIKFFTADGGKLSDAEEEAIEKLLEEPPVTVSSEKLGRATRVDEERTAYETFCIESVPGLSLSGMKIVVDSANGAAYKVAPRVFEALGAEVVSIADAPDGKNINAECGATAPSLMQKTVVETGADLGLALDGDADRLIMADHEGNIVDGDKLVCILAAARKKDGTLKGPVVGTIMSNGGAEAYLKNQGIDFVRAKVGDRHVLETLKKNGGVLGGESSGHIIILDKTTTGDGIIAAVQVLSVVASSDKTLKELAQDVVLYPSASRSVRVVAKFDPNEVPELTAAITRVQAQIGTQGRVVVRASGTEPIIRVHVEGADQGTTLRVAAELAETISSFTLKA
jgi:phosphoglucosamine mutase